MTNSPSCSKPLNKVRRALKRACDCLNPSPFPLTPFFAISCSTRRNWKTTSRLSSFTNNADTFITDTSFLVLSQSFHSPLAIRCRFRTTSPAAFAPASDEFRQCASATA
jgi:hypothetical protein